MVQENTARWTWRVKVSKPVMRLGVLELDLLFCSLYFYCTHCEFIKFDSQQTDMSNQSTTNNSNSNNNNNQQQQQPQHLADEDEASRQRQQYTLRGLSAASAGTAEQQLRLSSAPRPPPPVATGSSNSIATSTSNNPQATLRQQAVSSMVPQQQQHQHLPPAAAVNSPRHQAQQRGPFARSSNDLHQPLQDAASQFSGVGHSVSDLHLQDNPELQIVTEEDDAISVGWSEVESNGVPPSARSLHSSALLNGVLYVFGGYDGSQRVNSFHAYSFMEKRWSPVSLFSDYGAVCL